MTGREWDDAWEVCFSEVVLETLGCDLYEMIHEQEASVTIHKWS
jgi:hypothetical protein